MARHHGLSLFRFHDHPVAGRPVFGFAGLEWHLRHATHRLVRRLDLLWRLCTLQGCRPYLPSLCLLARASRVQYRRRHVGSHDCRPTLLSHPLHRLLAQLISLWVCFKQYHIWQPPIHVVLPCKYEIFGSFEKDKLARAPRLLFMSHP